MENRRDQVQPLSTLAVGTKAAVVDGPYDQKEYTKKLLAMGLFPGAQLLVKQTYPLFIIEVDQTVVALDHRLAMKLLVSVSG